MHQPTSLFALVTSLLIKLDTNRRHTTLEVKLEPLSRLNSKDIRTNGDVCTCLNRNSLTAGQVVTGDHGRIPPFVHYPVASVAVGDDGRVTTTDLRVAGESDIDRFRL